MFIGEALDRQIVPSFIKLYSIPFEVEEAPPPLLQLYNNVSSCSPWRRRRSSILEELPGSPFLSYPVLPIKTKTKTEMVNK